MIMLMPSCKNTMVVGEVTSKICKWKVRRHNKTSRLDSRIDLTLR